MARTNAPITTAANNGQVTIVSTAIDPVNGHNVPANSFTRKLVFRINNTFAGTKVMTIRAGVYPPAHRSGIGDLAITLLASTVSLVQIESARYVQADGSINIDFAAASTGFIEVLGDSRGNS